MAREKAVFRLGHSPLSGKVYAGLVRGHMFVGKKHDVTDTFLETMLVWATTTNERERVAVIGAQEPGVVYELRVRVKRVRVRPAKGGK